MRIFVVQGLSSGVSLYALFNMNGIQGTINFYQESNSSNVTIAVNMDSFRDPGNYSWYITENLISYSERDPCNKRILGNRFVSPFIFVKNVTSRIKLSDSKFFNYH